VIRLLPIALSLGVACAAWAHPTSAPRPAPPRVRAKPQVKKASAEEGRPWLGVRLKDGTSKRGVELEQVIDGTPARQAGLRAGDVILGIDKRPVTSAGDLQARVGALKVGQKIKVEVLRGARRFTVTVTLAPKLDDQEELERLRLDRAVPAAEVIGVARDASDKSEAMSLASLRGKVVIVEFLATWCGPCKSTYRPLGELQAKRRADGLVVLGISEESEASLRALATQEKIGFTLARDIGSLAYHAFHEGVAQRVTPTLFVIDREGVVRFVGMGAGVTLDHAIFAAERALGAGTD
jgi:peroxiredoxin